MKRYLITFVVALSAITATAVPAKRGQWRMITLADGTQVRVELRGDEYAHYMADADGNCYAANELGTYEVADIKELSERAASRRSKANGMRKAKARKANNNGGYHGTKKGIIILAEYTDVKFIEDDPLTTFYKIANQTGYSEGSFKGSVRDYFSDQSNGDFILDFDVLGPIPLEYSQSYYGQNDARGDDMHPGEMVKEACKAVDDQVNFADYDWDNDGYVDQVYVIYAGMGEADGGSTSTIWPHEWDLYSATGSILTLDGVKISTYACGSELNGSGNTCGIGTLCHEFSHCLGFPDFYDTRTNGTNFGMDSWDLMDYGSYNNNGYRPSGYTSYEKWWAGWLTPIELDLNTLDVTNMKPLSEHGDAYVIYNDSRKSLGIEGEYYLLENRQLTGWDASLGGKGLLVLHVDYDAYSWNSNVVNNTTSRQRCTIIAADNSYSHSTLSGDTYPYGSKNSLTNTSTPKASVYNANTDGSYLMNKPITEITQNSDRTISFKYVGNTNPGGGGGGDDEVGKTLFYESFDKCAGYGGNDDAWSPTTVADVFFPDNDGWTEARYKYFGGDRCALFGTAAMAAKVTTPEITMSGASDFSFKAGAWASDKYDGTTLTLSVSSGTITPTTVTLTRSAWSTFKANIEATGDVQVTFSMDKGRFFLDEVQAVSAATSSIQAVRITENRPSDNRIYSIDGRFVGTDLNALRHGIYIQNGRKIVR